MLNEGQFRGWVKSLYIAPKVAKAFTADSKAYRRNSSYNIITSAFFKPNGEITRTSQVHQNVIDQSLKINHETITRILPHPLGIGLGEVKIDSNLEVDITSYRLNWDITAYVVKYTHTFELDDMNIIISSRSRNFYFGEDDTPYTGHSSIVKEAIAHYRATKILSGGA